MPLPSPPPSSLLCLLLAAAVLFATAPPSASSRAPLFAPPVDEVEAGLQSCPIVDGSGDPNFLHYLRIGKAGSTSLRSFLDRQKKRGTSSSLRDAERVLDLTSEKHNCERVLRLPTFNSDRSDARIRTVSTKKYFKQDPEQIKRELEARLRGGILHVQHAFYMNFSRHGLPQPSVMTMLREPVSRYISQYYYWRTLGGEFGARVKTEGIPIEKCIEAPYEHTPFSCPFPNYQTSYLCGNDPVCIVPPNRESFELARHNLLRNVDVVGVVENITLTTKIIARAYPSWFTDNPFEQKRKMNSQRKIEHSHPDPELVKKIKEYHLYDDILYKIAKMKMLLLGKRCGLLRE